MTDLDRRAVLALSAAAAAIGVLPSDLVHAQAAAPAAAQAPGFYRYKVGDATVTAINDGFAMRPLEGFVRNAELDAVKKAMDAAFLSQVQLQIPFTTLVIQSGGKTTLIDTGNGDLGAPTSGRWMGNFKAAGLDPNAVDTVVISHFHGDHINGLRLKDGTAVFPKAEVMVPEAEWAFWMSDERMNAAPEGMKGAFANCRRVFGTMGGQVKQYKPGEVIPGLTAVSAPGHTPGHTIFFLSSGNGKLMIMSDTTNHPALFVRNPDWSAIFDMNADEARATRRKLLDMASVEKAQVAFYHAPFPATGYIAKSGNGFEMVPAQWTSAL